jgi:hypothetical protein
MTRNCMVVCLISEVLFKRRSARRSGREVQEAVTNMDNGKLIDVEDLVHSRHNGQFSCTIMRSLY